MSRAFDHLVVAVHDLERARTTYAALGFALTPPAVHPFGTRNSLVQLANRTFLELLEVADSAAVPPHGPDHFSFAAFNRDFLARRGEAASMLAFATADAEADVAAFRAAGLPIHRRFDFGRDTVLPGGGTARVGFSLAFATNPALPDVAFFTCQHRHEPGLFWKAEYQGHANGALGLTEIVMIAARPADHTDFLAELTRRPPERDGTTVFAGDVHSRITIMAPTQITARYPDAAAMGADATPRILACKLSVANPSAVHAALATAGIESRWTGRAVVVPPGAAHGCILELAERE